MPASKPLRRLLLARTLGLLGAAFAAAPAHAQESRVRFTLDWRIDGPGAIALLPFYKGYFKQEKLDVSIDAGSGSAAAVQRIAAGTHDIGFADTSALVEFLANNPAAPKMQLVYMLMERTPAAAFALKSSGITKPADLVGKRMGAPVFDAGRKTWPMFAKANRIDPGKANWTNVDPALRETLLVKGDLDVITGFYYTSVLNLESRGVKESDLVVFRYADHGVDLYGNAVIVSPRFAAENPQAVRGFLRALNRGIRETIADPKAAIQFVKQREATVDAGIEERRLRYFLDHFVATPKARAAGLGTIDAERLRGNVAQIVEAFGLKESPDPRQLVNDAFLPAAAERRF
ncbi:MAG TPA: ABC transporter substrate-binding protein [Ramlibacter sp.]|nr:ABC transporter substrate-binding protein [Ramlibacter sp.]